MRRAHAFRILVSLTLVGTAVIIGPLPASAGTVPAWRWLNPLPRGDSLNAVSMSPVADSSVVWAVGDYGCVLKSTDDGATWIEKASGVGGSLNDIEMVDDTNGWAVGEQGTILKIANGTCGLQTSPTAQYLFDVSVVDGTHAWAVGWWGAVVKTDDGTNWTSVTPPATNELYNAVYFENATTGWIAGEQNRVYYTDDAGAHWYTKATADASFSTQDIVADGNTLWLTGLVWPSPVFYRANDPNVRTATTDLPLYAGTPPMPTANGWLSGLAYVDSSHVWACTTQGEILFYNGSAWSETTPYATAPWFNDVDFRNSTEGVCVGDAGVIARTSNGGATWQTRTSITDGVLFDLDFVSAGTGFATSGSDVIKTIDAGASWQTLTTGASATVRGIDFLDATHGWAVGTQGTALYYNGASWTSVADGLSPGAELYDVSAPNASNVWTCGYPYIIAKNTGAAWTITTDVDRTWTDQWRDVDFFDSQHGIVVGNNGMIVYTADGGAEWTKGNTPMGGEDSIYSVDMVSPLVGFAVGSDQTGTGDTPAHMLMLKTTDGGASWTAMDPPAGHSWLHLEAVSFANESTGWIVGGQGTLMRTSDGGTTWTSEALTDEWMTSVFAFASNAAWAGGYNGQLITNGAYSPVSVWRFFRPSTGTHFYTSDPSEKEQVKNTLAHLYVYEGAAYEFNAATAPDQLHRFYNFRNGTHFYTAEPAEFANVYYNLKHTYSYDGPAYRVSVAQVPGRTVWRFFNKRVGSHFYTADPDEKAFVQANLGDTFDYEGPGFYLPE